MGEETKKDLLVIAVTAHDPNQEDDLKAQEAMDTAPDVSVQLSIMRKEKFEVLGRNVGWWLYVKRVDKEEKGYIPSTCVVPLKDDLTHEEEEELSHNVELTADLINPEVDLKFFPATPVDKDVTNRGVCPEQNANVFSKLTFWWLNGLIYTGFKRPLVDEDLWALGKDNKSVNIVPKFMEKWAKEEKRCAIGKRCPLEDQQEQEQERDKLTEENDETKVEFVPKNDEKQSKDKKTDKKRPSLVRAMVYQFGPQFFIGMILKLIYDVIQFVQPQLVK
ncbi:multidrug resistance-associated protein 1-like [Stylophora pistillata]|uniref:multidrug resistance-associated protein 1-like n=1 Tax=Stylophora pistillata TaxID=50429 RepID=UPI000C053FAE|nr:multidrug resistance-associated protein 1-like [Stylophora pistillata]